MPKNSHLNLARKLKRDEFYTCRSTVEDELYHYKDHFRGKTVLCNCDDDEYSEFFKYFQSRFDVLELKKLIGVHYENKKGKPSYKLELYKDTNKDGVVNFKDKAIKTPIYGNDEYPAGDFRSPECIELLKEADIVVTNPPFSLWRKFLAQLMEYDKKFLIIGNTGCVSYKEVFPLLKDNKMWLGYQGGGGETLRYCPEKEQKKLEEGDDGYEELLHSFGNICFFTNLTIAKRNKPLKVEGTYYTPEKYPKYDNYDAINVDKVADIPCDYPGVMGVPLTFMDKYCPEQFRVEGLDRYTVPKKDLVAGRLAINSKVKYARIFVKNNHPEWSKYRYKKIINNYIPEYYVPALTACELVFYDQEVSNFGREFSKTIPLKMKQIPGTNICYKQDNFYKSEALNESYGLDPPKNSFKWNTAQTNIAPDYSLAGDFAPTFTVFTGFTVSKQL